MKVLGLVNCQSRGVIRDKEELEQNENGAPPDDFSYGTAVLVMPHRTISLSVLAVPAFL